MKRYQVTSVVAYGRKTFRVVDMHNSGERPYVVARCDTPRAAYRIADAFNANPLDD